MTQSKKILSLVGAILLLAAFIVPPTHAPEGRYEITGEGDGATVRDTVTGLVWQRGFVQDLHWDEAQSYCDGRGSGFRLPSLGETETLVGEHLEIDQTPFPTPAADDAICFWTSSPHARSLGQVYCVNFAYGATRLKAALTETAYVRCVR